MAKQLIKILHLSDVHFNSQMDVVKKKIRDKILQKLIDYLKNDMTDKNYSFDFVFITGDIAFKGTEQDYVDALKFFKKLKKELNIDNKSLVVSNGNHDCNHSHSSISKEIKKITDKHFKGKSISKKELDKLYEYNVKQLETGNCAELYGTVNTTKYGYFNNFCKRLKVTAPSNILNKDDVFISSVYTRENVTIFCPDSSINSISGNTDNGNLHLPNGPTQYCIQKIEEINNPVKKLRITLMHQPPSWLHWSNLYYFSGIPPIFTSVIDASDLILCGHVHNNNVGFPDYIKAEKPIIYGGTLFSDEEEIEEWFSVNIITIDEDQNTFAISCIMKDQFIAPDKYWVEKIEEKVYPLNLIKNNNYLLKIKTLEASINEKELMLNSLKNENQYLYTQLEQKK